MKIIWLGLLFYSGVLVFIAYKVLQPKEIREAREELVLQIVAISALIASHVVPKIITKQNAKKKRSDLETIKAAFTPFILSLTTTESVVILGLVLVSLTGQPQKILPFAMAGILNFLFLYPKKEKILGTSDKIT